jgi:hypothetical protein
MNGLVQGQASATVVETLGQPKRADFRPAVHYY